MGERIGRGLIAAGAVLGAGYAVLGQRPAPVEVWAAVGFVALVGAVFVAWPPVAWIGVAMGGGLAVWMRHVLARQPWPPFDPRWMLVLLPLGAFVVPRPLRWVPLVITLIGLPGTIAAASWPRALAGAGALALAVVASMRPSVPRRDAAALLIACVAMALAGLAIAQASPLPTGALAPDPMPQVGAPTGASQAVGEVRGPWTPLIGLENLDPVTLAATYRPVFADGAIAGSEAKTASELMRQGWAIFPACRWPSVPRSTVPLHPTQVRWFAPPQLSPEPLAELSPAPARVVEQHGWFDLVPLRCRRLPQGQSVGSWGGQHSADPPPTGQVAILAARLAPPGASMREALQNVATWEARHMRYSVAPPRRPAGTSLAGWTLRVREGWCLGLADLTARLLAGHNWMPRIVIGYAVPRGGRVTLTTLDAHAWLVLQGRREWAIVDPVVWTPLARSRHAGGAPPWWLFAGGAALILALALLAAWQHPFAIASLRHRVPRGSAPFRTRALAAGVPPEKVERLERRWLR